MAEICKISVLTTGSNNTTRLVPVEDLSYLPLPVHTTNERDALTAMPDGSRIFNTTTNQINTYENSAWRVIPISQNGSHTTNWSGIWESAQAGNIKYQRLDNQVSILIPDTSTTATTAAYITMDTVLPVSLRPTAEQCFPLRIVDNATIALGQIKIATDGNVYIYRNIAAANFAGSGNSGMYATSVIYLLS